MESDLMVDEHDVYHGEFNCRWSSDQWFECMTCGRKCCYCAGHDSGHKACDTHCDECCPCGSDEEE